MQMFVLVVGYIYSLFLNIFIHILELNALKIFSLAPINIIVNNEDGKKHHAQICYLLCVGAPNAGFYFILAFAGASMRKGQSLPEQSVNKKETNNDQTIH